MFGTTVVSFRSFAIAIMAIAAIALILPAARADDMGMGPGSMGHGGMGPGGMGPGGMAHHKMEATTFGEPGDPRKVSRTVTIEATEIAFNVHELKFKKGETVRFIFTNKGEQPHEFVIADTAEQARHRKMMTEMAGMTMHGMGMGGMHHNDANVISTEPGETRELVWTFTKTGSAEFSCNYPGHAEVGMQGKIEVN